MGVTQYIGSRYVPVFADPAEWNNTRTYEPLTIVLHEGNSYTSKQYVPKGIDISNADFWAETGNYNSQIEQYRQEVSAFDSRITANADAITANADAITAETTRATAAEEKLNKHQLLVIGDSYTKFSNSNWAELFAKANNMTLTKHATSSMAFHKTETWQSGEFINNLDWNDYISNHPDELEYLICYGGINDTVKDSDDIQMLTDAVKNFIVAARAMYKNAKIYIVGPQRAISTTNDTLIKKIQAMNAACVAECAVFINAANWQFWFEKYYSECYASDKTHPSEYGYLAIAEAMNNSIFGDGFKQSKLLNTITSDGYSIQEYQRTNNSVIYRIYANAISGTLNNYLEIPIETEFLNQRPGGVVKVNAYRSINGLPAKQYASITTTQGTSLKPIVTESFENLNLVILVELINDELTI